MVGLEPRPPQRLVGAGQARHRRAGDAEVVGGVGAPDVVGVGACVERLERVLADRLEHGEALAVGTDEALVDERADRLEVAAAHVLDRLERAAPGEDRQPAEERLLGVAEQLEAPADRVAQRPVPVGRVPRPRGEQLQRVRQPGQDPARRQHLDPDGGQLDRERQAVEVVADLRARSQLGVVRLRSPAAPRAPARGTRSGRRRARAARAGAPARRSLAAACGSSR